MAENPFIWSITAASNGAADAAVPFPEAMLPGAVNNSARGLMAGIARLIADWNGTIATGGGANIYTVTSNCGHTALTNGILIAARASFTNTASASLNLNSYGAKNIRVWTGGAEAAVAAGQIISGGTYQFRYDSAADTAAGGWILLNPSADPIMVPQVGEIKIWTTDTLPSGYLWANGAAVSRSTYATLFGVISTTYGTGDGSTTFNVPDLCGRAPFGSDDMGGITLKSRITNAGSGIVGTTLAASGGAQSVTLDTTMIPSHQHTGTTAAETTAHTHTFSGTTSGQSVTHTHGTSNNHGLQSFNGVNSDITYANGALALSFWANTGNASVDHSHTYSGTTSDRSASHTHDFTTAAAGGGLAHSNMPPALIVNYIIKT